MTHDTGECVTKGSRPVGLGDMLTFSNWPQQLQQPSEFKILSFTELDSLIAMLTNRKHTSFRLN